MVSDSLFIYRQKGGLKYWMLEKNRFGYVDMGCNEPSWA